MDTAQFLEKLPRFIQELKRQGYSIGTDEAVNAHKIILKDSLTHHTEDEKNATLHSVYLQHTLSPVFCSSEEQQQNFRQHLDNWLARNNLSIAGANDDEAIADDATPPAAFSWPAAILLVIALALGISAFLLTPSPSPIENYDRSIDNNRSSHQQDTQDLDNGVGPTDEPTSIPTQENTEPTPNAIVRWVMNDNSRRPLLLAGMLISASIALLLWRRRRAQITRGRTDGEETTPFSLSHWAGSLRAPIAVRKSIQRLRVHELVRTNSLDINASIRATIAHGGLFQPITGTRPQLPEFILLIESNSVNDHQRVYSMQWYHYLLDQGLIVTPYWYTGTPWQDLFDELGHRLSWQQLVGQNSQKRLLVMGDAEQWFHPITGQLPSQSQDISEFSRAALLTPKAVIDWDNHEWQFQQLGLVPFHFDIEGVQQLSNYWQQDEQHLEYIVTSSDRAFPTILEDYQIVDYRDFGFVERVVASLEDYLSPRCFKLLCATAIYPECHFGITRHLASDYIGDLNSFNALDKLSSLCRLPWMRKGVMPDHLRLLLLQKLDRKELDQLRNKLARNLKLEKGDSSSLRLRRFLAPSSLTQRWLRKLLGRSEHSSFSRDAIFVKIMSGKSPLRLTLASATAQRWSRLTQQRWFMPIAVIFTLTATLYGWLETVPELSTWISAAVDKLSYAGFFLALGVAIFFTIELYRNKKSAFRYSVKRLSQTLIALNLVYLLLTELTETITLTTSLPYYQCVIFIVVLHLQNQMNLPLNRSHSSDEILNALATLPLKTLARWVITCGIVLTVLNSLFGTFLFSLINRDQNFWEPTAEPLGAIPNLASDLTNSLYMASMIAAIGYSLRSRFGWSHRLVLRVAITGIEVKFLLMAIVGGLIVFTTPFMDDTSGSHFLKAIANPAMSYPAVIIAVGLYGATLGMFDSRRVVKKGFQSIIAFSLLVIAYYPFGQELSGGHSMPPSIGNADFALGGFLAYCLLIGSIGKDTKRGWRDPITLFVSLLLIIALSAVPSSVVPSVLGQSVAGTIVIGLLHTLFFVPAVAIIFLTYLQRRIKQTTTQSSHSGSSVETENNQSIEEDEFTSLPWWGWFLLPLLGLSLSGINLYWADSSVSFFSDALLYLTTLWICVAHGHSLRRAFILITITALASMIALPALVPAVQVLGQSLEADTWLNLATLLCCLWFSRFLSTHWQGNHLSLPNYDSLWRPLGLLLLTSIAADWYVTENTGIGWGLAWLPVWVLVFMGRSFSRTLLWVSGVALCMLSIASSGVNAWLQESWGIDNLYLNLGLYGVALSTIPMALFLGYWLSKSDRLLSAGDSTLKILLPLLLLCLVDLDYSSDWPIDDSYYNLNGSIELAHAIMFALGFISRRHMNYGVSVLAIVLLSNTGQWINETYAAEAPQAVELEQQQQQDLQKRPLPPTLYTVSKSNRQPQLSDSDTAKTLDESPDTKKGPVSLKDEVSDGEPMKIQQVTPPKTFWEKLLSSLEISFEVPFIIILSMFLSGLAGQWLRHKLPPRFSSGATMKHATSSREESKQYAKR